MKKSDNSGFFSVYNPITWVIGVPTLIIVGFVVGFVCGWSKVWGYDVAKEWQNYGGAHGMGF
jgi:hypothetical protein